MHPSAARLRAARRRVGLARDVLARRIGKSPTTLQRWESGGIPDAEALSRLAAELGVTLDWLLGAGAEEPPPPP